MSKKNKKFKHIWKSQTDIGKEFGLSAVAIGKILIENGLKDSETKLATSEAIDKGFAKSTPLKDGTPYFMWNQWKIKAIVNKEHKPISKVDYWVNEVKKRLRYCDKLLLEGHDKLASLNYDVLYEDVPENIEEEVRKIIDLFLSKQ